MSEPVMCPACGWTGQSDSVAGTEAEPACPVCGAVLGALA
ncbi:hypothetical protein SAMN04487945_0748 [Halobacterium jilantaiense]|uniref:Small CPxCG-related zinc finger protein n=1 Tax=Halobacterium jilantaiense TaxID=355548 RepID=A0A1I0NBL5_9EURY|nr:hypothetical protein SAMN04487945_0748 [Halobacterium jilantaiense]